MTINKQLSTCLLALWFATGVATAASKFNFTYQNRYGITTVKDSTDEKTAAEQPKDGKAKPDDKLGKGMEKELPYDQLIKKPGSVREGIFTVRHIEDKWYFEIPDSIIGRYLLAVTRFTGVPQSFGKFSGEAVNQQTIYFEQRDAKNLVLRAYVLSQEADPDSRISKTLKASTVDPIIASFKVIGRNKTTKAQMIEVTPLFAKDNGVVSISANSAKELKLGALQADRTFVDTMKVYPINVEVATTRTYASTPSSSPASATGAMTVALNTSIVLLPKVPMRKRVWDNRVGYFTNRYTIFSDDQTKTDRQQFISRFRLEPKDVRKYRKGQLTEPIKPIVFYIDPATPKKWVPYLKKGIEDWNVAFEAAGFKNAIRAEDFPDDSTMSVDDARFSVLRYLPAEIENAYGPRIVDPRSGEIIESHICWYHNVMNLLTKWYMIQCGPLDKRAQTMKMDDSLMGELIRFVSSHEVGHTLGLRHNMGASHATPVEKLRDKKWVEQHGHTASIMDYARFNYVAQPEDGISERGLFPRINDYDKWAIRWGYQYRPEFKDEMEEKEKLMDETTAILAKNPRLWFGGEGRNEDPRAQTEDLGDDNVKASDYGIKNLKRIVVALPEWTRQKNDQYKDRIEMWQSVIQQFNRYTNHVLKNVGGRYLNNMPGQKPYEVAPAQKGRDAVDYIGRQLFDAPLWLYPSTMTDVTGVDAADEISAQQTRVLKTLLNATLLDKIYKDQQAKGAYQFTDYLNDVFRTVWKPLTGLNDVKARTRRLLERAYVEQLDSLLNPVKKEKPTPADRANSSDAMLYMEQHLAKIEAFCKAQAAQSKDIDLLHYNDLLRQLKLIRERRVVVK
ncbi:zinc-dependent metalloprotease [Prevotella aurantiaca]|uniref:zinc-dependent metalloprotease n=1 Tax=Prevotella aurantiaca TaxID=596085 RepID=UPI0028EBAB14|nr:zinc-dependent metalloprotease [Prevotella aurantiaca]